MGASRCGKRWWLVSRRVNLQVSGAYDFGPFALFLVISRRVAPGNFGAHVSSLTTIPARPQLGRGSNSCSCGAPTAAPTASFVPRCAEDHVRAMATATSTAASYHPRSAASGVVRLVGPDLALTVDTYSNHTPTPFLACRFALWFRIMIACATPCDTHHRNTANSARLLWMRSLVSKMKTSLAFELMKTFLAF